MFSYNMDTKDLPDIYARASLRAAGPRAQDYMALEILVTSFQLG